MFLLLSFFSFNLPAKPKVGMIPPTPSPHFAEKKTETLRKLPRSHSSQRAEPGFQLASPHFRALPLKDLVNLKSLAYRALVFLKNYLKLPLWLRYLHFNSRSLNEASMSIEMNCL